MGGERETTVERRRNEVVVTVRSDVPDEGRCVKFPLESVKIWPVRCVQQEVLRACCLFRTVADNTP